MPGFIASLLLLEAVGEGPTGMRRVADTIYNRAALRGTTPLTEAQRPRQYAPMDEKKAIGLAVKHREMWDLALDIDAKMTLGRYKPETRHTHFYAHDQVTPGWASKLKGTEVVGRHTFGRIEK